MLIDLIKKSWKPLILIALVSITITWAFNIQNTMIQTQTINGIQIKTFSLQTYLQNINNAWNNNALNFNTIIPQRTWQQAQFDFLNQQEFWNALINDIAFLFDWSYFPINFILYILRWLCWLARILLAIIGWNTQKYNGTQYYSELIRILDWIIQNLIIPYI